MKIFSVRVLLGVVMLAVLFGAAYGQDQYALEELRAAFERETEEESKSMLYLALTHAQYDAAPDKEAFIAAYLGAYQPSDEFDAGGGLRCILDKIIELGIREARQPLQEIRDRSYQSDEQMQRQIDAAVSILDVPRDSSQELYQTALTSSSALVRDWAIERLTRPRDAVSQDEVNRLLIDAFSDASALGYALKSGMDRSLMLRAENRNPCLEPGAEGQLNGWSIRKPAATEVIFPSQAVPAASFAACLEVSHHSLLPTIIEGERVDFAGKLPRSVEYGLTFRMAQLNTAQGADEITPEMLSARDHPVIKVQLSVVFAGDTVQTLVDERVNHAPFEFSWTNMDGFFKGDRPIVSAKMRVFITGAAHVFLDDLYVRRGEGDFVNSAPQISRLEVPDSAVVLAEGGNALVSLKAVVSDPDGDPVSGLWQSDREGILGEGLALDATLTRPGVHVLTFTARDASGLESAATATVNALVPALVVIARDSSGQEVIPNASVGGTLTLALDRPDQLCGIDPRLVRYAVYINERLFDDAETLSLPYPLDTTRLSAGLKRIVVKCSILRYPGEGGGVRFSYHSNVIVVNVDNPGEGGCGSRAPRIIAPSQDAMLEPNTYTAIRVVFDDLAAYPVQSVWYYYRTEADATRHFFSAAYRFPYASRIDSRSLPRESGGCYIGAVAHYVRPEGTIELVDSAPVRVFVRQ